MNAPDTHERDDDVKDALKDGLTVDRLVKKSMPCQHIDDELNRYEDKGRKEMKVVELEIDHCHKYPNPRLNIVWDVIRK